MSTLKTDTLANVAGTKSAPVGDLADGRCTAWVNFNGIGTVAIRDSFNVSSITDNGVGDYTINFATVMANTNYCPNANGILTTAVNNAYLVESASSRFSKTISAYRISFVSTGFSNVDMDQVWVAIHGGV